LGIHGEATRGLAAEVGVAEWAVWAAWAVWAV